MLTVIFVKINFTERTHASSQAGVKIVVFGFPIADSLNPQQRIIQALRCNSADLCLNLARRALRVVLEFIDYDTQSKYAQFG
jgi:hydroxypyruvate isomerase